MASAVAKIPKTEASEHRPLVARRPPAAYSMVDSPIGRLLVASHEGRVAMVDYIDDEAAHPAALARLGRKFDPFEDGACGREIAGQIARHLQGDRTALSHAIDFSLVEGAFQRKVLSFLTEVPCGSVITYQALAGAIGAPRAARAVGNALHTSPIAIFVPCHRVVRADGLIRGYAGGFSRKAQLLRAEGVAVDDDGRVAQTAFWTPPAQNHRNRSSRAG